MAGAPLAFHWPHTDNGNGTMAIVTATHSLADLHIPPWDLTGVENPVVVIHAPRESGCTSLIAALLAHLPALQAAVVLTDRAYTPGGYMQGALPRQVVLNKDPAQVLKALIGLQNHSRCSFPDEPLPRLALALDDVLYRASTLKADDFKRDLKIARDFNIAVIIATADTALLPGDVHTFATHVMATKCVHAKEPKALLDKLFVMYDSKEALVETLAACGRYEFLVGCLRACTAAAVDAPATARTFSFRAPPDLPVFAMAKELVQRLSLALNKALPLVGASDVVGGAPSSPIV